MLQPPLLFFVLMHGCEVSRTTLFVCPHCTNMDNGHTVLVTAAVVAIHQLLDAYAIIFDDTPTKAEQRNVKKRKRELTPHKRNGSTRYGRPTTNLELVPALEKILQDINRPYIKDVTHLHSWQFFLLADRLKDLILRPRLREDGTRPERRSTKLVKHDHFHRLYFCLKWLNDGNFYKTRETETGWGKSSLQEDTVHVLEAIVEGLDDELQWPNAECRQELGNVFQGIFHGCIGIADVKEFQVIKHKNLEKERKTWSGKKKINSYKFHSVMDHSGRYTFAYLCLGKNDREVFTSSPLYLHHGDSIRILLTSSKFCSVLQM
jgi:hypothetical protein